MTLKAPFPWFGGKSRCSDIVWRAFGDVPNYCEPFAGSLAVLLNRADYDPAQHTETVNDLDCYLANFWRALQSDPEQVSHYANCPINEADLHARHQWLVNQSDFREKMKSDPDFFDVKIAGWWVWGICSWIGSGWCEIREKVAIQIPHLGDAGRGVHRKRPHLLSNKGINRTHESSLTEYMIALSDRLRRVRVCCGEWDRILGPSPTYKLGVTGVFLDPPYDQAIRTSNLYAVETPVSAKVREWAIANGDNPKLRIALCGYEGEHEMPDTWECVSWNAIKGYARGENENNKKERIWFSPHCLKVDYSPIQLNLLVNG